MKSIWLILAGLFWLGMNVLLWRSEYGGGSKGNPLPVKTVISKIMDTPDPSELDIFYRDKPIGHCRWVVAQMGRDELGHDSGSSNDASDDVDLEAAEMSGLIRNVDYYTVHMDGHVQGQDHPRRIRFMLNITLSPQWEWTSFNGKVGARDQWFHIHSDKEQEKVVLQVEQDETHWDTQLTFAQLKNPQAMISQWGQENPILVAALAPVMGMLHSLTSSESTDPYDKFNWVGDWSAFSDWMSIAHSRMRIYRLESGADRRNSLSVTVNRAGEILAIKAPQQISLRNESVIGL